jgi:serine protease Do
LVELRSISAQIVTHESVKRRPRLKPRAFTFVKPALIPLCALTLTLGCTFAQRNPNEILVQDDAPVFDPRFRDIDPNELDLSDFWRDGRAVSADAAPITIHQHTYADIVEAVSTGVVNIYTLGLEAREARLGIHPSQLLPIHIPFISEVLEFIPFQVPIPYATEGISLGSGFLINDEGYILTNAHVVHNATDIRVVVAKDRTEYPARIIGMDRMTDTALIHIDPQPGMTPLRLGDSGTLRVGEIVLAVGNPLGLNHTVSSGLISAKERLVPTEITLIDYLQTDSAINPGSSGGPLLNLRGEVIGINTAILSNAENIGFAIPIDTIKRVMAILVTGQTERGWFGAASRPTEPGEAEKLGHSNASAVMIESIVASSPAEKAGVQPGDLVVRIGGAEITDFVSFQRELIGLRPGQAIELTLLRDGVPVEISSILGSPPRD